MGKAFLLIAYGMAWGYVIHAKEIDKKVAAVARDAWEGYQRAKTRISVHEVNRLEALAPGIHDWDPDCDVPGCPVHGNPRPEGAKIVATG